jgi:hypothetical protein
MFETNYYALVAGLREYTLDGTSKGFDPKQIREEVLAELTSRDKHAVEELYGYYDCLNLVQAHTGAKRYHSLGNLSQEELPQALAEGEALPQPLRRVVRAYAHPEGEEAETIDVSRKFEHALFDAYYRLCAASSSRFLRAWSDFDRTLRNVTAALVARRTGRSVENALVGNDDISEQLRRSSAVDFGLRGELPYLEQVTAAVNEEENLLEKEARLDRIRWQQAVELAENDYFNINAILSYLVRVNLVARWVNLDEQHGREMLQQLLRELDGKEQMDNK